MIKRFFSYYRPHKFLFAVDMLCAFLVAGGDLLYPVVTRNIIDQYIPNQNVRLLVGSSIALVVVYVIRCGLNYIIQYYGHIVGVRMQADMREELFSHLQKLPFTYFDENKTGIIMSRIVNDLMEISELAHHGPEDLFVSVVMLTGSFIIMCGQNLPLTLIIFACLPLLVVFALNKRVKMNKAFKRRREEVAEVNATIENSISGIRVAKAFCSDEVENKRFVASNSRFQDSCRVAYRAMAEFHSGMELMCDLIMVVVILAGGLFAVSGRITAGQFASYIVFVSMFFSPVRRLTQFTEQYQAGMTGFERFCSIIDLSPEEDDSGAADISDVKGEIEFNNVSFSYENDTSNVLHELNFKINKGDTVALVGPSGGGKTTVCHLIPRFYEIKSGQILLDGRDIKTITRNSLRSAIGIVEQAVFLFTGSVYENIAYGSPEPTREMVEEAAKRANIHEFIMSLPDGYNTYIGEHGIKLSGGQRQRIAIARVFLKNPPILILDEATSALDNQTEQLIQGSLDELSKGRTTVVVAHRLSTVKNANRIIVLNDEGVAEEGTHEELMKAGGIYSSLYLSQFRGAT